MKNCIKKPLHELIDDKKESGVFFLQRQYSYQ